MDVFTCFMFAIIAALYLCSLAVACCIVDTIIGVMNYKKCKKINTIESVGGNNNDENKPGGGF